MATRYPRCPRADDPSIERSPASPGKGQPAMFHQSFEALPPERLATSRRDLLDRGFINLRQCITGKAADLLLVEIERLKETATPTSTYGVVRNAHGSVVVMNRLDRESDLLYDMARHPALIRLAEGLLGKAVISLHVEYFAKDAVHSAPSPPHQDHVFYQAHFDDELALSIWIALDDVTQDGGALEFGAPTVQRLLEHVRSPTVDFDYELTPSDASKYSFVVVPVPRCGCVIHHSYAVHRAGVNRSGRPRRAIVFNYRGSPYRHQMRAAGECM
jgi:hypothetical protein